MEGHLQNLALFATPPTESGIKKIEFVEFRPIGSVTTHAPIEFAVPDTGIEYVDLKRSRLYMKVKIVKLDGSAITEDDGVALVNIPLHAFWRQVDVQLQENVLTNGVSTNYAYKSYIDIITSFDEDCKETFLQGILYAKDSKGEMDDSNPITGRNLGLKQRFQYTKNGHEVELEGPIYTDITMQNRFILNGVKIRIKLFPSLDSFRLMSDDSDKYGTLITDIVLKVCKVTVSPLVTIGHDAALKLAPAIYPIKQSIVKVYNISANSYDWTTDDLFSGRIPSILYVTLVHSDAYTGAFGKNPYNFKNFDANFVAFYADGTSVPGMPFQNNYSQDQYVSSYLSLFNTTGLHNRDKSNYIDRLDYAKGYTLYVFDVDGHRGHDYTNKPRWGHTRLGIRFGTPLPSSVSVICYAKYDATMLIDHSRNVMYKDEPFEI